MVKPRWNLPIFMPLERIRFSMREHLKEGENGQGIRRVTERAGLFSEQQKGKVRLAAIPHLSNQFRITPQSVYAVSWVVGATR